jgi:hypothetical protein
MGVYEAMNKEIDNQKIVGSSILPPPFDTDNSCV